MKKAKPNKVISVAIIGAGYWGKNLVRNFQQLGSLKLICDKNESLLVDFKNQYAEVETCLAITDVMKRKDIEGVVISTPAESHFNLAREALLAGKNVLVEKPLVLHENEAVELIALAAEKKRVLMVGHLLHYHPVFVRLKEMASAGELGRINYIYSHRLNLGKIRREENILWSFAPHDISMILALADDEPESVLTIGGNYLHQKIADVTTTHLEFSSGLQAHIFVSWLHPFKDQKLVVVGDRKMAVFDDTQPWPEKLLLYPHQINWKNNMPVPCRAEPERVQISEAEPLQHECRHFLDCISNGSQPITDGHEGLKVLRVLNASQISLNRHGRNVCLPINTRHVHHDERLAVAVTDPSIANENIFVHATAIVDENVTIRKNSKIWHFSHVLAGSTIGEGCNIGQNVVVGPDVTIGKGCKIQNNVSVYKGVTLEDEVFCGPSIVFTNIYNPRAALSKMDQVRPTRVKKGATIGANATVVCGTTLGRYCFIGAGSVVNKNVPDHAIVVGNPAKQIGWACVCGERLTADLKCLNCGSRFKKQAQGLVLLDS
jgi:UDP-2-acetamido-3-amino-2,3-dideoxy-glucuronate N-acetyltransferase